MVKNDYTLLKKENRMRAAYLNEKDQASLERMSRYLESKGMNPYDNAVMQKELISMALEAEVHGQSLEEVFGIPEDEFCDRLSKEGRKMTFADRIAFYLPFCMKIFALFYLLQIFLGIFLGSNLFHAKMRVSLILPFGYVVWFAVFIYFGSSLWTGRGSYMKEGKQTLFLVVSALLFIGILYLILGAVSVWIPTVYWEVPAFLYILGWIALWLMSEWYQKKRSMDLASDHPWAD